MTKQKTIDTVPDILLKTGEKIKNLLEGILNDARAKKIVENHRVNLAQDAFKIYGMQVDIANKHLKFSLTKEPSHVRMLPLVRKKIRDPRIKTVRPYGDIIQETQDQELKLEDPINDVDKYFEISPKKEIGLNNEHEPKLRKKPKGDNINFRQKLFSSDGKENTGKFL